MGNRISELVQHRAVWKLAVCARLPRICRLCSYSRRHPGVCELVPMGANLVHAVHAILLPLLWAASRGSSGSTRRRMRRVVRMVSNGILERHSPMPNVPRLLAGGDAISSLCWMVWMVPSVFVAVHAHMPGL